MRELSIFSAAQETPHRDCIVADDLAHSFADMAARAASAVEHLRRLEVAPGAYVELTPHADIETVAWLYALFEMGTPALLVHPRLTDVERASLLERTKVGYTLDEAPPPPAQTIDSVVEVDPDQTLAVVFTSGTSGAPRGALLSRRAFVASARAHASNLGWQDGDRWLLTMPPAHVGGLSILTRSLIARRCVVLDPGPFDARTLPATMSRHRVTLLSVVPTMLRRLIECDPPWRPHPELRAVLVGGAPFPDPLRARAIELGIPVLGTYGCTEACSQVATQTHEQGSSPGAGSPLEGIEVRIRNDEVQVRGQVTMDGYLDGTRSSDTWTEDGWLRTGDLGEIGADGQLQVRGRRDDVIISGGENVSPLEVEAWLESMPGVVSACVFGVRDDEWGQRVVAALVVQRDAYDEDALRDRMVRELAGYKRPKEIALLDALRLNRAGKVDRGATAQHARGSLRPI